MSIQFFQPFTHPGTPCLSPFCAKLDMIMQLSGLDYENRLEGDPSKGPKGKVPFIEDNGTQIGDSNLIGKYLSDIYNVNFWADLSAEQVSTGRVLISAIEERLYWILVYSRWYKPENAQIMKDLFFGQLPDGVREKIADGAEKAIKANLLGQGTARHTADEIFQMAESMIADLETILGSTPYFYGNQPTMIDASAYGVLINFITNPVVSPVADMVKKKPSLVHYLNRISKEFFPNLPEIEAQNATKAA